jgi:hypothetical protein
MPAMLTVARRDVRGSAQGNHRKVGALIRSYARRATRVTKGFCSRTQLVTKRIHLLVGKSYPEPLRHVRMSALLQFDSIRERREPCMVNY